MQDFDKMQECTKMKRTQNQNRIIMMNLVITPLSKRKIRLMQQGTRIKISNYNRRLWKMMMNTKTMKAKKIKS